MNIINSFLNLIYPPVCGICNEINSNYYCNNCKEKIHFLKQSKIELYNNSEKIFYEHFFLFKYEKEIRNLILDFKFNEKSYLYKTFSKILISDSTFKNLIKNYDCITCVPLHKKRLHYRGYNQSELIAKEISSYFKIPYYNNILEKNINISPQSSLSTRKDRILNVQNAFSASPNFQLNNIINKKIILFDDIFTTGSTVNECSKILKNLGASQIRHSNTS